MDIITGQLLAFFMVLTRISAFFAITPLFSWQGLPARIKLGMALFISGFIAVMQPLPQSAYELSAIMTAILLANEIVYGMALGIICILLFSTIRIFGRIVETQMGLNMSQILDPLSGEQSQPLSMLIEFCFILMFFAANGHHLMLMIISKSFESFPLGTAPTTSILLEGVVQAGSLMLIVSLKMAGPLLAAFLFMLIVLAIFARIAPEMNILFLSMPVRVAVGLIMAAVFVPYTNYFVKEMSSMLEKILPI